MVRGAWIVETDKRLCTYCIVFHQQCTNTGLMKSWDGVDGVLGEHMLHPLGSAPSTVFTDTTVESLLCILFLIYYIL